MSATVEGSDGWAPEDELDLGQEDELTRNGGLKNGTSRDTDDPVNDEKQNPSVQDDQGASETANGTPKANESPLPRGRHSRGLASADETASTPDDTPSLHDSIISSPSSSALAFRGSPRVSPSPSHRPFDLRFKSRLSSSGSLRPSSPYLARHSRQSSLASQLSPGTVNSDTEFPEDPWDVVRWTKLRRITGQAFSEVGKRNFGYPTCLAVSTAIVLGTSKGVILVFDYQQNLKTVIGQGTNAVECGAITSLALSADHSTIAGGHAAGDIFTWEVSRSARPFLHIPPIPSDQVGARTSDGHLSGSPVIHVGFLGTRRTALVSADSRGMAFSHLATRGMGAVRRTVKTTRILGRYPQTVVEPGNRPRRLSSILAFSSLPLGNVEQPTDSLGLVAMLTPYLLVIVSTTPVAQTQHKMPRPREVQAHGAMTGTLAWFPAIRLKGKDSQTSKTKLAYCWSNVLTVLEVSELEPDETASKEEPPTLALKARSRWKADEAIVAVQWLSRSVLAVLTITQQLLILEDNTMRVTDAIDLINRHVYHADLFSSQLHTLVEQLNEDDPSMHGVVADAFFMSFRSYKGRLFLLGYNEVMVGSLSNWADRLLALMEAGDFIAAIRLATAYYKGSGEKLTVGLPDEDALRQPIVKEKLLEMILASLKYAFGRNAEADNERLGTSQLRELAEVSIEACVCLDDEEFLWVEVFSWYEDHESPGVFLDALESYIVEGAVRSLPPTAVKALITHFTTNHTASSLEEIICLLDTTTMDIDQVTTLCKHYNLYDAYIYVWNRCVGDFVAPLQELLGLIPPRTEVLVNGESANELKQYTNAMKMFPYLSFVLTGRIYPTGNDMDDEEATRAKSTLYDYLFSGNLSGTDEGHWQAKSSFSDLQTMLNFDTPNFMSMLNEAFEDSFLNQEPEEQSSQGVSINRQYLISILFQVMSADAFAPSDTIYLDMFVARNLPKYPQYILLSGSTLHQVLERLCRFPNPEMAEDCELSAEYLLSIYHPPDIQSLVPLFREARFFRILKSTYRAGKQFPQLILAYLEDPHGQEEVYTCLQDCLRPGYGLGKKQRRDVIDVIKEHTGHLVAIDVRKAAQTMENFAPELHETFLKALDGNTYKEFQYLSVFVEPQVESRHTKPADKVMVERYVQLLCKYNPSHVADFVEDLRVGDVRLEELLPSMEDSGVVDAAIILLARQGQVRAAMDRLISHLGTLESGLVGILRSVQESPDSATTAEAVSDLVESLNKYAQVGTWLCKGQTKTANKPRTAMNGRRSATALEQPLAFDETLWLDLIEAVVRIASNVFVQMREHHIEGEKSQMQNQASQLVSSIRTLVQQVFTALLSSTVKDGGAQSADRTDIAFLRILRAFLTRAATWSPSLLELRAVLASIFSAYTYERSLLSLANGMLDKDLFVHVDEVARLRQRGWRPRGQVCEICRHRVWGPGVGASYWEAWEKQQQEEEARRVARRLENRVESTKERGKGKAAAVEPDHPADRHDDHERAGASSDGVADSTADPSAHVGPVVVFSCRHLFHQQCLYDLGHYARRPSTEIAPTQHDHYHLPDASSWKFSCPTCT